MGPCGISVQFVVDLYCGDHFVAEKNHTVKMCIYSSIDYVLDFNLNKCVLLFLKNSAISRDCNISFSLQETRPFVCKFPEPKRFADGKTSF